MPTHGAQQLSFFNGHYDAWCSLPGDGFCQLQRQSRTVLFSAAVLRPGNVSAGRGGSSCRAPAAFGEDDSSPGVFVAGVQIRVRLDGGFAHPAVLEFLDAHHPKLEYVVAIAGLSSSGPLAWSKAECSERASSARPGKTEHLHRGSPLQGREVARPAPRHHQSRGRPRAADKDPKDNPRFVITNEALKQSPQWIYERVYCQRGDIENRIKELHELDIDRTSCSSFWANQFRVLLTAAAYVLMQELRLRAAGTACARAQVGTLRERLLKLGARVLVSVRRVVVHLPASFPFLPAFRRVALALGAATG